MELLVFSVHNETITKDYCSFKNYSSIKHKRERTVSLFLLGK